MSAKQPNLGNGARRLAALSCGLGLWGIALGACGSTGLPAGLGTSREGQTSDGGVIGGISGAPGVPGRGVTPPSPTRPSTAPTPAGSPAPSRPTMRDAGVGADGGFPGDGGLPPMDGAVTGFPDGGVVGIDAGLSCTNGVWHGDLAVYDRRSLMMLRGCKEVTGSLTINVPDFPDLSDLSDLTSVGGTLQIGYYNGFGDPSNGAKSLKGLENLRSAGSLLLMGPGVTSLEPLSGLSRVIDIQLMQMNGLTDLKGFGQLTFDTLSIDDSAQLKSLDGLRVPEAITTLRLNGLPKLENLKALAGLRKFNTMELSRLPIKNLDGLQGVQPGAEQMVIGECNALTDLTGLGAYPNQIEISSNAELRSLAGPAPAARFSAASIVNNPKLESLGAVATPSADVKPTVLLQGLPSLKSLAELKMLRQVEGIGIGTCDGLKDFTGLEGLVSAQMFEVADCAGLQSLKGLDALQTIEYALLLDTMINLTSLQGMPKLQSAGGLWIRGTNALPNLQGLEALTKLGDVEITGNLALSSLTGLEKVSEVMQLNIMGNPVLLNLTGLSGLQKVSTLNIAGNPSLKNLQGIGLRTADAISIETNPALVDLTGLENVASIASTLSILSNGSLSSLRALTALNLAGGLFIQDNRRLPQCEIDWLSKRLNMPVPSVGGNGPPGMCAP